MAGEVEKKQERSKKEELEAIWEWVVWVACLQRWRCV